MSIFRFSGLPKIGPNRYTRLLLVTSPLLLGYDATASSNWYSSSHGKPIRSRVCETVERPSVCPSVRPNSRPLNAAAASLLLWARRTGNVDRLLHGWRSAANASSVTLSADVGSWTQSCRLFSRVIFSVPMRSQTFRGLSVCWLRPSALYKQVCNVVTFNGLVELDWITGNGIVDEG